ncbi:MAG: DUF2382 domain-containing protein, partial [Limisphaerales bacterium]
MQNETYLKQDTATRGWDRLINFEVQDETNQKIGTVDSVWTDESDRPAFLGVKTGWLFGKTHVVPVESASVNDNRQIIRVPYHRDKIKEAPSFDPASDLSDEDEQRICSYYGAQGRTSIAQKPTAAPPTATGETKRTGKEGATMQLSEEELKVGKREVIAGGVRLRKIIRTETVNQPVELKREEVVIERVPASEARAGQASFKEEDVFIPLRREEPVVQKQERVREEVRVRKEAASDERNISGEVRKE